MARYNCTSTWSAEIYTILNNNGLGHYYYNDILVKPLVSSLKDSLWSCDLTFCRKQCSQSPMLEHYTRINNPLEEKAYLKVLLNFILKKQYVQARIGILPIQENTGRYERPKLPRHLRLCSCDMKVCQDTCHFFIYCPNNVLERDELFGCIGKPTLEQLNDSEKLYLLLNDNRYVRPVARFIFKCIDKKSCNLV